MTYAFLRNSHEVLHLGSCKSYDYYRRHIFLFSFLSFFFLLVTFYLIVLSINFDLWFWLWLELLLLLWIIGNFLWFCDFGYCFGWQQEHEFGWLTFLIAWLIASYGLMLKDWSFVDLVWRLWICNYLYFEFL